MSDGSGDPDAEILSVGGRTFRRLAGLGPEDAQRPLHNEGHQRRDPGDGPGGILAGLPRTSGSLPKQPGLATVLRRRAPFLSYAGSGGGVQSSFAASLNNQARFPYLLVKGSRRRPSQPGTSGRLTPSPHCGIY